MAIELAPHKIRVNTLAPTFIETPMTRPFFENKAFREDTLRRIKLGRLGQLEDLTGAIAQGRLVRDVQPGLAYLPAYFRQRGWFTGAYGKIFHKNDDASWDHYREGNPISPQEIAALKGKLASAQGDELLAQAVDVKGLKVLAAVLQGKHDNYDTDLMRALIEASAHASSVDPDGDMNTSHRVIADHLRSTSFLIADGVMPSNDGRGYVLRRIMRRAMRHAHMLGNKDPMMHRLVPELVKQMGAAYPELVQGQSLIEETLLNEEIRFKQTLDRGLKLLDDEVAGLAEGANLPGEAAFKLYDTFGFPLDLTQDALREKGRAVDLVGFDAAMAAQKAKARAAWAGTGEAAGRWRRPHLTKLFRARPSRHHPNFGVPRTLPKLADGPGFGRRHDVRGSNKPTPR